MILWEHKIHSSQLRRVSCLLCDLLGKGNVLFCKCFVTAVRNVWFAGFLLPLKLPWLSHLNIWSRPKEVKWATILQNKGWGIGVQIQNNNVVFYLVQFGDPLEAPLYSISTNSSVISVLSFKLSSLFHFLHVWYWKPPNIHYSTHTIQAKNSKGKWCDTAVVFCGSGS